MRLVDRRIGLLFALFLLLLALAATRAAWLGTVRSGDLRARAATQHVKDITVPAPRGTISDRHGTQLAVSEDAETVFADPQLIHNPAQTTTRLAPLLGVPAGQLLEKLADRSHGFVYLKRKLDPDKGEQVKKLHIEGIDTVTEPRRRYPQGSLAAQVLGFVGTDNTGLAGLEQSYEKTLHGSDGKRKIVKDALGKPVSLVDLKQTKSGKDVRLTLDTAIQERTESVLAETGIRFGAKGATAVVMDPRNGDILALANWPRVNPNNIAGSNAYARQDRAVAANYEPGSTFKAITVSGALQSRLVTPNTLFELPPTLQVADRTIEDAHPRGAVTLTVAQILAQSSNIGAVKIGMRLGAQRFDSWVRRFGFGRGSGVDLPGEEAGIVPHPAQYSGSSMGNLPMGQGLAVTPIQMAAAYSAIANGGVMPHPHVVAGRQPPGRRIVSAATAHQVATMLEGVLGPGGTAPEAAVPGYKLAGKTGTAEKPDARGGYSNSRFVGSFIGFAPARHPRLLVAVMVDEPKGSFYGGVVAAPAFEKIVSFVLPYLRIAPG